MFTRFLPIVSLLPTGACGKRGAGSRSDRSSQRRSLLHSPREAQLCFRRSGQTFLHLSCLQVHFTKLLSRNPSSECSLLDVSLHLLHVSLLCALIDLRFSLDKLDFFFAITVITGTPGRTSTDRSSAETLFDSIITSRELKRHAP